ncbi:MAG: N-6 DNA methylase [Chloroflexi bacterium]|nr:N-6 DNA methylase [Chloroflexota bacterium]
MTELPETSRGAISALLAKYEGLTLRQRRAYNETQTRNDFIDPLFAVLGWDMRNVQRNEVDFEAPVSGGRADYAFKVNGIVRFYLEAKQLDEDIHNPEYAKQVITYAYNKGVTWAVLCNFAGLQVFNAEWETPDLSQARVLNLTFESYLQAASPLGLLSREALLSGDLDRHAQTWGGMRPRLPVEKSLFAQLKQWRERLFNGISRMRSDLSREQVDEAIQRLLNRLIFIRTCEDRRIEDAFLRASLHQWQQRAVPDGLAAMIEKIFADYDGSYDSDLFAPLAWADEVLKIGGALDDILVDVLRGLYEPPRSLAAYDFSVIDADVLGRVYEQYLGHVAGVTRERAIRRQSQLALGLDVPEIRVEAKREKRKEHGIYYTPKWVVDYIVKQTLARYLEEHSHHENLNVRVLDAASGSGSFLIGAFDALLRYHSEVEGKPVSDLDHYHRLGILTRNIYGVDLDRQAVEIARLNLMLRCVAKRETLPSLKDNIIQGNSLISGGEAELRPHFGDAWRQKHPLNWEQEFPEIMGQGGFDLVIGNPPYVRIQTLDRQEADYYRRNFATAFGSFDIYILFIEQAIRLLKPGGYLGFITSGKFLKSDYGKKLCHDIHNTCTVEEIIDLSALQVFEEATTYPILLILRKGKAEKLLYYSLLRKDPPPGGGLGDAGDRLERVASQHALTKGFWPPQEDGDPLTDKLFAKAVPLREVADKTFVGLQTSADKVYVLDRLGEKDGLLTVRSSQTRSRYELEGALLKPLLSGQNTHRYSSPATGQLLLFPYDVRDGKAALIGPEEFENMYPRCWAYLNENRQVLEEREGGKMRREQWYAYVYPKNLALHDLAKLAIPRLIHRLHAFFDSKGEYYLDNVDVGGLLLKEATPENYSYVAGLLNGRLLDFYHAQISPPFRGGFRSANRQFLEPLPIRRIDFNSPDDKQMHDRLVALVERMLELHKRLAAKGEVHDQERAHMEHEIALTDREIDNLVYDLYELTEEERKLVEEHGVNGC